jgi:DNA-binding CsgD family transcriptional regulator
MTPCKHLRSKEVQIAILVWEGLTNREIGKIVGTSEQVIKNHLRSAFDKIGVWSRLKLAMYVASHGGRIGTPRLCARPRLTGKQLAPNGAGRRVGCECMLTRGTFEIYVISRGQRALAFRALASGCRLNSAKPFTRRAASGSTWLH